MPITLKTEPQSMLLADEDLETLKSYGKQRSFRKGESFWQAGDDPDTIYILQGGKVNMVIANLDGKDAIVQYCAHTDSFCMAAAVTGRPYPCSATAAMDMTVIAIPRARFTELQQRLPSFARHILGQMADQICESHKQAALASVAVKGRLADLLGRLNKEFVGRELPFTRQELANMTGTTVESAIRAMSDWEKQGVIRTEYGHISVRRPEELEAALV